METIITVLQIELNGLKAAHESNDIEMFRACLLELEDRLRTILDGIEDLE